MLTFLGQVKEFKGCGGFCRKLVNYKSLIICFNLSSDATDDSLCQLL